MKLVFTQQGDLAKLQLCTKLEIPIAKNNKQLSVSSGYPEKAVFLTAQPPSHFGVHISRFLSLRLGFFTLLIAKVHSSSRLQEPLMEVKRGQQMMMVVFSLNTNSFFSKVSKSHTCLRDHFHLLRCLQPVPPDEAFHRRIKYL